MTADVFADEEHPELHAGIFGMIAGDQFAFRPPAGRTAARCDLGQPGDEKSDETEELRDDKPQIPLSLHDVAAD